MNHFNDHVEIVIEAPGIEQGSAILSISEDGTKLKISIESHLKDLEKVIQLPFVSSMKDHNLDINNGIISIIMRRSVLSK